MTPDNVTIYEKEKNPKDTEICIEKNKGARKCKKKDKVEL